MISPNYTAVEKSVSETLRASWPAHRTAPAAPGVRASPKAQLNLAGGVGVTSVRV